MAVIDRSRCSSEQQQPLHNRHRLTSLGRLQRVTAVQQSESQRQQKKAQASLRFLFDSCQRLMIKHYSHFSLQLNAPWYPT
ncbi:hypothetical protein [Comamonas terrae]|uniref:Uncharacterized protein n=1 Tax=Comamonas terrae TaxID=673548 RepID=A0ABW5UV60_9BURK|nr:hypothetical protein [Comamonas terrae]